MAFRYEADIRRLVSNLPNFENGSGVEDPPLYVYLQKIGAKIFRMAAVKRKTGI